MRPLRMRNLWWHRTFLGFLPLLMVLVMLAGLWGGISIVMGRATSPVELSFSPLAAVGNRAESYVVAVDQAEYDSLWQSLWNAWEQPAVDFQKSFVVGVFYGERPTGGCGMRVKKVAQSGGEVTVTVERISPRPGAFVTMVITYPGQLVAVNKNSLAQKGQLTFIFVDQEQRELARVEKSVE
ncbi:MAG: protease complex subunit PrcB family protein [Syntrophothermus sp.]